MKVFQPYFLYIYFHNILGRITVLVHLTAISIDRAFLLWFRVIDVDRQEGVGAA